MSIGIRPGSLWRQMEIKSYMCSGGFPKGNGKSISYQVNPIATKGDGYDIFD